jgi:potassium channel LctB
MTTWPAVLLGLLLIMLSLLDIVLTVLHIQAESPLSNRLNRLLWRALLALTRPLPGPARAGLLGWGIPLMVGADLALWFSLYIVGFGLVYTPFVENPGYFATSRPLTGPLSEALYFSAVSFFTVGYGDIVPIHTVPRMLAVTEAGSGLLATAIAVAYLLAVFPLISRQVTFATALNQETGGRADGVLTARRYLRAGCGEALLERLRWANDELLVLNQAHAFYPVLHYVRPRAAHDSFARVLALTQGLVGTLRYALDPTTHSKLARDPRLLALEEGLLTTLHSLGRLQHLQVDAEPVPGPAEREMFAELAANLRRYRLEPAEDSQQAEDYARFRAATDPYILAYAENVAYTASDIWGVFSRRERDADLEEQVEPEVSETKV